MSTLLSSEVFAQTKLWCCCTSVSAVCPLCLHGEEEEKKKKKHPSRRPLFHFKNTISINSSVPLGASLSSDSCQRARKRSSATYCFLAGPVWATLSECRWSKRRWGGAAGKLNWAEPSRAELFSRTGRPPGLRHHQLPELRESGGLVRHGEEGQWRVRHPACHLPDRE